MNQIVCCPVNILNIKLLDKVVMNLVQLQKDNYLSFRLYIC